MKIFEKEKEYKYRALEANYNLLKVVRFIFDKLQLKYTETVLPYEENDVCQYVEFTVLMDMEDHEWFNKNFMSNIGDRNRYNFFEV